MKKLKDIVEENVGNEYFLTKSHIESIYEWKAFQRPFKRICGKNSVCPTVTARGAGENHSGMILYSEKLENNTNCETKNSKEEIVEYIYSLNPRFITPLESWRAIGYTDEDFYKAKNAGLNKKKLYERAGRGISIKMLKSIFYPYFKDLEKPLRVFESFSGIGSQRMTIKNMGIPYESVGIMEVDKYALLAYNSIHNKNIIDYSLTIETDKMLEEMAEANIAYNFSTYKNEMPKKEQEIINLYNAHKNSLNFGDISKVNPCDLPDMDFFTYSFPCKNISLVGKQDGLEKDSGTQSALLWECEKIIRTKRPKFLMMENVKNLCGKKHMEFFQEWIDLLTSYGYKSDWKVYDAQDYDTPQHRERVIMMSVLQDIDYKNLLIVGDYIDNTFYEIYKKNNNNNIRIYCNDIIWKENLIKLKIDILPITELLLTKDFRFDCILTTQEAQEQIKPYKKNINFMITYDFHNNPPTLWEGILNT